MEESKRQIYFEMVDRNIQKHGFHVTYVLEEMGHTPFGYSTGLYKNFRIPEAIVSGLPNGLTNTLINNYANIFRNKKIELNKKLNNLIDRFPVYIVSVKNSDLSEKILSSFKFYDGKEFDSIQIIFPDLTEKFPTEIGYDYDQQIFADLLIKK